MQSTCQRFRQHTVGFPGGSDGKEAACNAEDLGSISGLGRSPGGRLGNPLQYSDLSFNNEFRNLVQSTCQRFRQYRIRSKCGTFLLLLVSLHAVQSILYFISLCYSEGSNSFTNLPRNLGMSIKKKKISVPRFFIRSLIFLLTTLPDLGFSECLFSCPAAMTQESCG